MEKILDKEPVKRVQEFIFKFNSELKVLVLDTTAKTAKDAATSLGCEVGAIVKSLLFKNVEKNEYYLCLVSGDQYMSLDKLSKIITFNFFLISNSISLILLNKITPADLSSIISLDYVMSNSFNIFFLNSFVHAFMKDTLSFDSKLKSFSLSFIFFINLKSIKKARKLLNNSHLLLFTPIY